MDFERLPLAAEAEALLRLVHWSSHASRHLRRRLADVASQFELSDTELLMLWACSGAGRVQVELAGEIGVSPAQTSGMVERLHARGLIAMRRQAVDRRRQVCEATPRGAALLASAAAVLADLASVLRDELTRDEQQLAEALCQRLTAALKDAGQIEKRTSKEAA